MSRFKDIGILISISVLTFLGLLFAPGSFLIHPTFEIEFEKKGGVEFITVTNTGLVQAKNVMIHLKPGILTGNQIEDCPEGVIAKDWENGPSAKIELSRMSPNLDCFFLTIIVNASHTERITVTADDSPAYIWKFDEKTTESVSSFADFTVTLGAIFVSLIVGLAVWMIIHTLIRKALRR